MTEGNGLPLSFLVTAANVSEVTVGLEVVDRVKVPKPQDRPRQRPASLAADKSYDSADFRWELRRRGIQLSIPRREWKTVADGQVDHLWCITSARVAGKWNGATGGWTTAGDWLPGMTDTPNPTLPF